MSLIGLTAIFGVVLICINAYLTYETLFWIPFSISKRIAVCSLIWFLPLVGTLVAAKMLKFSIVKSAPFSSGATGAGLMEADAVFNPQARHVIEYKQEKAGVVLLTERENVPPEYKDKTHQSLKR